LETRPAGVLEGVDRHYRTTSACTTPPVALGMAASVPSQPEALPADDIDFAAEFGRGELARRLWRGGLRLDRTRNSVLGEGASAAAITRALGDRLDPRAADSLVADMRTAWADAPQLVRACRPLRRAGVRPGEAASHVGMESLVKAALAVEAIQPELLTFFVQRIAELADDDLDSARAVLSQLKWLDFIVDSASLCETLLAVVDVIPPALKRDIIEALPEVIDDASRATAIEALVQLLDANHSMMAPIVDALGALGVDDARLDAVNGSVLAVLAAADREMLPVSIRYLIKTSPPSMLSGVVVALRQNLAMPSLGSNAGRLCFDATRAVADQAMKVVRSISVGRDHRPADIWIIIALLDSPAHRKHAETLFRQKTAAGLFSHSMLDAAIAPFAGGLADQCVRLISLASLCAKSNEAASRRAGVDLFSMVFRLFGMGTARRDVLNSLLEHTGSRRALEVDSALDALVTIAREGEGTRSLLSHYATLQGLLDFLEAFSDPQLRKIWTLFALVCRSSMPSRRSVSRRNPASQDGGVRSGNNCSGRADGAVLFSGSRRREEVCVEDRISGEANLGRGNRNVLDDGDDDYTDDDEDEDSDNDGGDVRGRFGNYGVERVNEIDCRNSVSTKTRIVSSENGRGQHDMANVSNAVGCEKPKDRQRCKNGRSAVSSSELEPLIIVLRKELTHTEPSYRHIGVLGACTLVKILGTSVTSDILRILIGSGALNTSSEALAFDELACVLPVDDGASVETLQGLYKSVSLSFEERFIANLDEPADKVEHADLRHEPWFNLDGPRADLCVPVSRYLIGEGTNSSDLLQLLAPQLRLVYTLASLCHNGSLEEIDAVIGCPIRLPLRSTVNCIETLSASSQRLVLTALLCGYSWLIEIVNGFAAQTNFELRGKCLRRLDHILELRELITNAVTESSVWRDALMDAGGAFSMTSNLGVTNSPFMGRSDTAGGVGSGLTREDLISKIGPDQWHVYTRSLTPAAMALVGVVSPVSFKCSESATSAPREDETHYEPVELSAASLKYLLTELVRLIDSGLSLSTCTKSKDALSRSLLRGDLSTHSSGAQGTSHQGGADISPLAYFQSLRLPLVALGPQLGRCIQKMSGAAESSDLESLGNYQQCIILCLKCFAGSIASEVLSSDPGARNLTFDILAAVHFNETDVVITASSPLSELDIEVAARRAFMQFWSMLNTLSCDGFDKADGNETQDVYMKHGSPLSFEICSALLAVLDATFAFCSDKDKEFLGRRLSDASSRLLERQWDCDTLKAHKTVLVLPGLIRLYVRWAVDSLEAISLLREQLELFAVVELERSARERSAKVDDSQSEREPDADRKSPHVWGSISPRTSLAFYIGLVEQVQWSLKCFKPDEINALRRIEDIMLRMHAALLLVRSTERFIGPAMRAGRTFVELFLRTGLPFLKERFRQDPKGVVKVLKTQQKATRLLQSFCAHGKSLRDTKLAGLVPPLRKSLELLLYKVKEILQMQNKQRAFSVADLKNRNIRGDVVEADDQYLERISSEADVTESDSEELRLNSGLSGENKEVTLGVSRRCNEGGGGDDTENANAVLSRKRRRNISADRSRAFKKPSSVATSNSRLLRQKKSGIVASHERRPSSPDEYDDVGVGEEVVPSEDYVRISCTDELTAGQEMRKGVRHAGEHTNRTNAKSSRRSGPASDPRKRNGLVSGIVRNAFIDDEAEDDSGPEDSSDVGDSLSGFLVASDEDDGDEES
jgi:hypothetical protein